MGREVVTGYGISQQQLEAWRELSTRAGVTPREVCEVLLSGEVDSKALRRALEEMVVRHEILRTGYRLSAGMSQPWQVVSESCALEWREEREALEAGDPSWNSRAVEAMEEGAVDGSKPALQACALRRAGEQETRLLLSLPRLSVDRKSWANLAGELAWKYERLREGGKRRDKAEPEAVQYTAYAAWQRDLEESEEASEGRAYWRDQSTDAAAGGLLTIEGEVRERERESGTERVSLRDELAAAVASLSESLGVSEESALLACWRVLLWKLTGGRLKSVEVWFDGRTDVELEGTLGLFERWLPMRFEGASEASLRGLARETSERLEEHRIWQDCFQGKSMASAQQESGRRRRLEYGFEYVKTDEERSRGLVWRVCGRRMKEVDCNIKLSCKRRAEELRAELQFELSNYKRAAVERLAEQYLHLVESAAGRPEAPLRELSLISPRERRQLLEEWNATARAYPRERCIHQLFEEQVERTPGAVAVISETKRLTYRELNERANQLAHHLRGLGVGAETLVGLCVERSLEMIVGLLGILKAGGAYLPLDPNYPKERLRSMLEDAGVKVILTQEARRSHVGAGAEVICLDSGWEEIAQQSEENLASLVSAENLAYVIYTSGSTGKPKGVMVRHGSVVNLLEGLKETIYEGGEGLTVSMNAPLVFDASVKQVIQLGNGARLCIIPEKDRVDGEALLEYVRSAGIEALDCTPSHLRMLMEAGLGKGTSHPRLVLVGGEAIDGGSWREMSESRGVRYYNVYGPTECTVDATVYKVREGTEPTIGRPISNTNLYILDEEGEVAPLGAPGDLYIGGDGLARGYLARPDLTAERFVPSPYSQNPGARLYRTGDRVRYLPDGNIEYLGREDHQVKIRGFRIELGEIESALGAHEQVREAVVTVREDRPGEKRLVAYVAPDAEQPVSPAELRRYLRERLPEYMAPAAFVVLAAMPMTANGKIDRNALPEPGTDQAGINEAQAMPRTLTEELLCGIWQAVLGVNCIGIHDNFFDLGGHSLMAVTLIGRIRKTFQIEVQISRLFERPTVSMLASSIDEEIRVGHGLRTHPIVPAPRDVDLPLSFAQQRLWFIDQLSPGNVSNNIPGGIQLTGALNIEALERSLSEIIRRHESLRTRLVDRHGTAIQVIDRPGRWVLPEEDLSDLSEMEVEEEIRQRATADADRPFNLSLGPLLRFKLLRLRPDEHVLLITIHHIISDGWSLGVFRQELAALYEAFCEGRPSPLTELPIQYGDYAVWQRTQLQGEELERLVGYWERQLKDASPVLELPLDQPRPEKQRFRGAVYSTALSKDLADAAKKLGRNENATLFMTLLAGFNVLLYHYSGQEDIVVGTDVANRNRTETENLIGFFVNQLVLRTDLSGNPAFREIVCRVREVALDAYTHQDMPFDKLVEILKPERSLKYSPIFQVKLVLQNAPMPPLELVNLSLADLPIKSSVSKLDLTLLFWEDGDGLKGSIEYNTDLFDATSIIRLSDLFERILQFVVENPQSSLTEMKQAIVAFEREQLREEARLRADNNFKQFQTVKPQVVQLAGEKIVRTGLLHPDLSAPLVIEPVLNDADLIDWSRNNRELIERELGKHGALLFRGFNLASAAELERFAKVICPELFSDNGEHLRQAVSSGIYTPVFYPADKKLLWHNENSFNLQWPMKIWFCCSKPADHGGETPIVDSRKVFESISSGTRERFIRKGAMYVRNYGESLGLSWQKVFQTTSREEVEERCRKEKIHFEWKDGGRLVTRAIRPAVGKHPRTGEMVWFNQAQHWHLSCLDRTTRESLQALYKEQDLPRNCYYGDGSPIDDSEMDEILEVYRKLEISFPWQKWDILMLDNMLMAHGRNSFVGERKLLVAMGEMSAYSQV